VAPAPGTTTPAAAPPGGSTAVATTATTTGTRTIDVGGTRRSYLVVAPTAQRTALPLLVVLHGRNVTAQTEAVRTGFLPLAQRGSAVLAYPVGIAESWNAGQGCCGAAGTAGVDDADLVHAVVADASQHLLIDPKRRYLVGYSNGGKLAFRAVCDHPTDFAAFATYGAVPLAPCADTTTPLPALVAAGAEDTELAAADPPYTATHALDEAAAAWRARDGCSPVAATTAVGPVTVTAWRNCRDGTAVESALYAGLTHYWPTADPTPVEFTAPVGPYAAAATLMWEFLSGERRG
jgi:polyhydroxybutyrate depolymerase